MMISEPTMYPWAHDSSVTAPGAVGFKTPESVVFNSAMPMMKQGSNKFR